MKKYLLIIIITVLAFFLRFFHLGQNPVSLTWDEVAWGYNAYSFSIDGRDEFGRFLPINYIESFGDFKPPMYAYLAILPIKLFGLNEFAVRFPSALFGVLTVVATYFLAQVIFANKGPKVTYTFLQHRIEIDLSIMSSFVLAVSPWHINLSRAAFEANIATFFIVVGVLFFFLWKEKSKWYLLALSVVCFTLSLYVFNTARVVSPILFVVLVIVSIKKMWIEKKHVVIVAIVGLIVLIPVLFFLFTPQARLRFQEVNIFSDAGIVQRANTYIENDGNTIFSKVIHNRRWGYTLEFLRHYFDHFHPRFLFISGDGNPKFSTQDVGSLYFFELPFFIIGLLFLFRYRPGFWWFIPLWLLIGIVPAATARETPHALRIETTLPVMQMFVAFGMLVFLQWVTNRNARKRRAILVVSITLFFLQFFYYLHGYHIQYPREYGDQWQYGYKEAIPYVKMVEKDYDAIYFTNELGRPHIYFAFYLKLLPSIYREQAVIWREMPYGFVHVDQIGNVYFVKDNGQNNEKKKKLFIDIPKSVPSNVTVVKRFKLPNSKDALVAYTKN